MIDVLIDTGLDFIKLLPFLFLTYLAMEWLESHAGSKTEAAIEKAGRLGPVAGGILGVVPQCGFSAASANLFAGRVISMGTLLAVFLSTSDEMLPMMIADGSKWKELGTAIICKAVYGIVVGLIVDAILVKLGKSHHIDIHEFCEDNGCECDDEEGGILKPALKHTLKTGAFILIVSFIINVVLFFIGEESLSHIMSSVPVLGNFLAAVVGLIPNCAASVVLTQLYLQGVISFGIMMSGLLTGAGVGILVLCRVNHHIKENAVVIGLLYLTGALGGLIFGAIL